jgi:hypothetical protein
VAVRAGESDFVVYRFDMTFQVVWVHETYLAVRADKLVRPRWVMDKDMVTGCVSGGSAPKKQLYYVPQTMLANAIPSTVLAYESQVNHPVVAVAGNGSKGLGDAEEVLQSTLNITSDVGFSFVREQIGGMRNLPLSTSKMRIESWNRLCDSMPILAYGTQRRTSPNRLAKPRVISSMVDRSAGNILTPTRPLTRQSGCYNRELRETIKSPSDVDVCAAREIVC